MSKRNLLSPTGWRWTGYVKKKMCDRCKRTKNLVVHHKDRNKSNNSDHTNLETLCRICHVKEHAGEIAVSQRDPEMNARRGISIGQALKGKNRPDISIIKKAAWAGDFGVRQRAKYQSVETRKKHSDVAKRLMNDPAHMKKRRDMRIARRDAS